MMDRFERFDPSRANNIKKKEKKTGILDGGFLQFYYSCIIPGNNRNISRGMMISVHSIIRDTQYQNILNPRISLFHLIKKPTNARLKRDDVRLTGAKELQEFFSRGSAKIAESRENLKNKRRVITRVS